MEQEPYYNNYRSVQRIYLHICLPRWKVLLIESEVFNFDIPVGTVVSEMCYAPSVYSARGTVSVCLSAELNDADFHSLYLSPDIIGVMKTRMTI
jgi:hypothetical protein